MKFCDVCDNMYYTTVKDDKLVLYCKNCGKEETNIDDNCIYYNDYSNNIASYRSFINKYTIEDPTLPVITSINCPNSNCESNREGEGSEGNRNEVLFIKYDLNAMKYLYICKKCMTTWKNNDPSKFSVIEK
jgi:DNA-directed RNA polymerase subunit M/transcription elongation factor TFIIS